MRKCRHLAWQSPWEPPVWATSPSRMVQEASSRNVPHCNSSVLQTSLARCFLHALCDKAGKHFSPQGTWRTQKNRSVTYLHLRAGLISGVESPFSAARSVSTVDIHAPLRGQVKLGTTCSLATVLVVRAFLKLFSSPNKCVSSSSPDFLKNTWGKRAYRSCWGCVRRTNKTLSHGGRERSVPTILF